MKAVGGTLLNFSLLRWSKFLITSFFRIYPTQIGSHTETSECLLAGDGGGEGVVEVTDVLVLGGEGGVVPEGHEGVDLGLEFGVGTVEPEEEDEEVTAEDGVGDLGEDGVAATDEVDGTTVVALAVEVGQEGGHQEFCQGVGLAGREALPGGVLGAEGLDNVLAHEVGVVE